MSYWLPCFLFHFFSCYLSHPVLLLSWSRIVPFFPQSFAKLWVTVHDVKWHYNSSRWMSLFADHFWYSLGQAGAAGSGDGEVTCPGEVSPGAGPWAPVPGTVRQSRTSDIELSYMRSVHWSFAMCLGPAGAVRSGDGKVACPGGVSPGAGPRAPVPGTVHQLTEDLVGSHHCSDHAYVAALCQLTICCPVFRHGRVLRLW